MARTRTIVWSVVAVAAAASILVVLAVRHWKPRWSIIQGAVIRSDSDVRKQQPIAGVQVAASYRDWSLTTQSDPAGYFRIAIPRAVLPGQTVVLHFEHPGYKPLEMPVVIQFRSSLRRLVVAALLPSAQESVVQSPIASTVVSNIRVRYTVNSENQQNIGSAANTFEVVNQGNVPCRRQNPCSPDGYWKASTGSIRIDAGAGNEFRDARASCIAGPCPFTRIDSSGFSQAGRFITARALDWSSTATFLLQAEVFHTSIASEMRESYPVVFGGGFNFTAPPTAEGVSLIAEVGGTEIVFPLGPDLDLSWATCALRKGNHTDDSIYQCELKPAYRF